MQNSGSANPPPSELELASSSVAQSAVSTDSEAPYEGWIEFSGNNSALAKGLANGSIVYYNGEYWIDIERWKNVVIVNGSDTPLDTESVDRFATRDILQP